MPLTKGFHALFLNSIYLSNSYTPHGARTLNPKSKQSHAPLTGPVGHPSTLYFLNTSSLPLEVSELILIPCRVQGLLKGISGFTEYRS